MKLSKLWLVILAIMLAGRIPVLAQRNPNEEQGLKPYDSWHGGDLDSVSLSNGGLVLHIPLASFPQRGNLDLSFMVRFSTKQWRLVTPPPPPPVDCQPPPPTGEQNFSRFVSGEGRHYTPPLAARETVRRS